MTTDEDYFSKTDEQNKEGGDREQHPSYKWKEAGQELKGRMTDIWVQGTKDGRINYLAVIDEFDTDKVWSLWIGETPKILREAFEETMPAKDSPVAIYYEGKKDTQDGIRTYHLHRVFAKVSDMELWAELTKDFALKSAGEGSYGGGQAAPKQQFGPDESPF